VIMLAIPTCGRRPSSIASPRCRPLPHRSEPFTDEQDAATAAVADLAGTPPRAALAAGAAVSALTLAVLLGTKWTGAFRALVSVHETGALPVSAHGLTDGGALGASAFYLRVIAPALLFGVGVGASLRAAAPGQAWVDRLARGGTRGRVAAAIGGAPLMLCSCCVTPVFTAVHERTRRLAPALTLMLASPGLNVAALTLTFLLFPAYVGAWRLAAAALLVFALPPLVARVERSSVARRRARTPPPRDLVGVGAATLRAAGHLALVTVPLVVAGALASGAIASGALASGELAARFGRAAGAGALPSIVATAVVGSALALPTFFELPVAATLLALGAPAGAATALLVAGPIVNLPSLLVLAREAGPRAAAVTATAVVAVSTVAGAAAQWL